MPMRKKQFIAAGVAFFIIATCLLLWFFLQGESKITDNHSEDEIPLSFKCSITDIKYPFFQFDDSVRNTTDINAIFDTNGISSLSLIRKMFYDNYKLAKIQSDSHAFDMNKSFSLHDLKAYALSANFSINDNVAQMNLFAKNDELNASTAAYFFLDDIPKNYDDYIEHYRKKGFICNANS